MDESTIDIETSRTHLLAENENLRARLEEAEQILDAIRSGGVDALVIQGGSTPQVYTLEGADFPYRSIVETMAAGAVTLDRDQTIVYCNAVFSDMVGVPMERLIGSSFIDLVPAERRDTFMGFIERSRMENSQQELPLRTRSGKELYVHLAGGCELHDVHDNCIVVTDISARKRAEEALQTAHNELEERVRERTRELQESEARYRSLFSNMLDGFAYCEMVFDDGRPVDFVYLEVNDAFERLTGLRDLVGKTANEIVPGIHETNPELFRIYGLVASTGKPQRLEIDLKPLGTWFLISVYAAEKNRFVAVLHDITERKQAEKTLQKVHDELEGRVEERTRELFQINSALLAEIDRRKQAEESLDIKSRTLEEVNTALRVLLKQREEDKNELEENILLNVKELILPYVERFKKGRLDAGQMSNVDILETNLREITSPIMRKLQSFDLTPKEIEVVSYLKDGRTTKEIADLLGVSPRAVEFHRYNIRKKLGLDQKKANLRSYLRSIPS